MTVHVLIVSRGGVLARRLLDSARGAISGQRTRVRAE